MILSITYSRAVTSLHTSSCNAISFSSCLSIFFLNWSIQKKRWLIPVDMDWLTRLKIYNYCLLICCICSTFMTSWAQGQLVINAWFVYSCFVYYHFDYSSFVYCCFVYLTFLLLFASICSSVIKFWFTKILHAFVDVFGVFLHRTSTDIIWCINTKIKGYASLGNISYWDMVYFIVY